MDAIQATEASEKLHVHEVVGDANDCARGALLFAVERLQLLEFIIHMKESNNNVEQLVLQIGAHLKHLCITIIQPAMSRLQSSELYAVA